EPERARGRDRTRRVVDDLDVEGDAVAAGLRDRLEVPFRLRDHEVAVESSAPPPDERRDRREDDRPDRDLRDEVPVTDVEVENTRSRGCQRLELSAQLREVRRVQRRLDLGGACPFAPAHAVNLALAAVATAAPATHRGGARGWPRVSAPTSRRGTSRR